MSKALFAIILVASIGPVAAQSLATLMEKGIYSQETAGDYDEAIRIYRQILAAAPPREMGAQAQYRLSATLMQKGDLMSAAYEFQRLSSQFPEYSKLIASLAARGVTRGRDTGSVISRGTMFVNRTDNGQSGRYIHARTKVEFSFTDGWSICGDFESSDDGEQVCLADRVSHASGFIWAKPYDGAGNLAAELKDDLAKKPRMRSSDWKARPESVQSRIIAGEQALTAVADFAQEGHKMVEYCVWIRTTRSRLFFSMTVPAEDFGIYQSRYDQLIATVKIP